MHLGERRRGDGLWVEGGEELLRRRAQLLLDHAAHIGDVRASVVLEKGAKSTRVLLWHLVRVGLASGSLTLTLTLALADLCTRVWFGHQVVKLRDVLAQLDVQPAVGDAQREQSCRVTRVRLAPRDRRTWLGLGSGLGLGLGLGLRLESGSGSGSESG